MIKELRITMGNTLSCASGEKGNRTSNFYSRENYLPHTSEMCSKNSLYEKLKIDNKLRNDNDSIEIEIDDKTRDIKKVRYARRLFYKIDKFIIDA